MINRKCYANGLVLVVLVMAASSSAQESNLPADTQNAAGSAVAATEQAGPFDATAQVQAARDALDVAEDADADGREAPLAKANGIIQILIARDPTNEWLPLLRGRAYAIGGRAADGIDYLQKFVRSRVGRNHWQTYRLLGDLFVGEFPRLAQANYQKAIELNVNDAQVLFGLAVCATKLGALDDAIDYSKQAIAAEDGRTIRHLAHLANLYRADRRFDDAESEALDALKLARSDAKTHSGEAAHLTPVHDQYNLLIAIVQARVAQADEVSSDDFVRLAGYVRGRSEAAAELATAEALKVLKEGMDVTGTDASPPLLEAYGLLLAKVGNDTEAALVFRRLAKVDPTNTVAREWLAKRTPLSP